MDKYIINQIPKEKSLYRNLTLELLRTTNNCYEHFN
jgi:hypothetical protein